MCVAAVSCLLRKLGDSNPRYGNPYVSLANWWFQPLTQTSFQSLRTKNEERRMKNDFFDP